MPQPIAAAVSAAQAGTLWVRVLDRAGEPVAGAAVIVRSLATPGATQAGAGPVSVGCYLHSRMAGNIYISESPYFGVSDADGRARIDVPDGAVTVLAWHPQQLLEQSALPSQVVPGTQGLDLALNFTPRPASRKPR